MSLVAHIKSLFGDRVGEYCHDCGREITVVWHAPDELWRVVVGHSSVVLCVPCFQTWADMQGIGLRWSVREDEKLGSM